MQSVKMSLNGIRDCTDVIKLKTLKWGYSLDYPGGPNSVILVFKIRYLFPALVRGRHDRDRIIREMQGCCFEDGGRGHEIRNVGSL